MGGIGLEVTEFLNPKLIFTLIGHTANTAIINDESLERLKFGKSVLLAVWRTKVWQFFLPSCGISTWLRKLGEFYEFTKFAKL